MAASFLITAWALAGAARLVKSERARFRNGLRATALLLAAGLLMTVVEGLLPGDRTSLGRAGFFLCVQLLVAFVVLRRVFRLTRGRTCAPLGAFVGVNVVLLALVFFLVRPYLFESFVTPGRSMTPTIEPGDRFMVGKWRGPARWDLVVYWGGDPSEPTKYVKRLIGLPGEHLRFRGGGLYVNDKHEEPPVVLEGNLRASVAAIAARGGARYHEDEDISLGSGEYFFIGDNVEVSADSRVQGPSEREALIGVLDFVYWPPGKARLLRW